MTAKPILSDDSVLQVITRKEAMAQGLRHYYNGKPCINGHHSLKNLGGKCLECSRNEMREKRRLAAKPARVLLSQEEKKRRKAECDRQYRVNNPMTEAQKLKKSARMDVWRSENREKLNGFARKYYAADPEKYRLANKVWAAKNPEKVKQIYQSWASENKDAIKEYRDQYHLEHKVERNQQAKQWKSRNADLIRLYSAQYKEKHKDRLREYSKEYIKEKIKNNPVFAMKNRVRILILNQIRAMGYTKRSRTHEILGCNWEFFKSHIERQFSKGMTWENRSEWHIDHIRPLATASTEDDVMALNHFTNLRPIWAKDNLSKGAQITHLI